MSHRTYSRLFSVPSQINIPGGQGFIHYLVTRSCGGCSDFTEQKVAGYIVHLLLKFHSPPSHNVEKSAISMIDKKKK